MEKNITIVTGLWDTGRGQLEGWAMRSFSYYKERFFEMLQTDAQMCIWIPKDLEAEVLEARKDKPTYIFIKNLEDFRVWNPFFDKIQKIRQDVTWKNQASWLLQSPQAELEYYNAMMFTKMFMVSDSAIVNPFNSEYFFWIDGGLTNTVDKSYFQNNLVLDNLENYIKSKENKFLFIRFLYSENTEIHGFPRDKMNEYCRVSNVSHICRGGFFGGTGKSVRDINTLYYRILESTLQSNLMGADENLFTILQHSHPNLFTTYDVDESGLIWPFFDQLRSFSTKYNTNLTTHNYTTNLYILTFNFSEQLQHTINSMLKTSEWLNKPKLILLDNSTETDAITENMRIAGQYGIEYISLGGNTGICRGRQAAAEHFDQSDADFMFFFEDDMTINSEELGGDVCRNGFRRYIPNLYETAHKIMLSEGFDFLKLSFTEVYLDNSMQCSWYNVPQAIRTRDWPEYDKLPISGLDTNTPRTNFKNIGVIDGVSYISGEIYYSNWPMVVSKAGNKRMFIDTKWTHPHEQTWMSYIYQETVKGNIKPAVLLASPVWHDRIVWYQPEERREN